MTSQHRFIEAYIIEASDLLAEIDQAALSIEPGTAPSHETVNQLFRAFHTIKGSGGVCGLDAVVEFTHHIENLLDLVRDGKIPVSPALIDLVLRSEDQIASFLAAEQGEVPPNPASTNKLIADLCAHAGLPGKLAPKRPKAPLAEERAAFLF
jgi:two-component system, chemotaxis family, sensor kinase CheA